MGFLSQLLSTVSGNNNMKISEQLLFDKVIGFKSIVPGCGASTILQNVAIGLSEHTRYNICVLDTNFMYPIQYPLLATTELKGKEVDLLDFAGDVSKISRSTNYTNVYVVQLENRSIIDMLSGKDTEDNVVKLVASLKSYFDVILVDLSSELTNTAIHSAIKCNKIFLVSDTSFKSLYYVKKSLNNMVTLGIPLAKCNNVILNKDLPNVVLGADTALKEAGLNIIGTIPLSMDVAISCASGKKIYGAISKDTGISAFNVVVDNILKEIAENNPLNAKYFDTAKELARMEAEQAKKNKKEDNIVVEEDMGETEEVYDMEEIEASDVEELPEEVVKDTGMEEVHSVDLNKGGDAG